MTVTLRYFFRMHIFLMNLFEVTSIIVPNNYLTSLFYFTVLNE